MCHDEVYELLDVPFGVPVKTLVCFLESVVEMDMSEWTGFGLVGDFSRLKASIYQNTDPLCHGLLDCFAELIEHDEDWLSTIMDYGEVEGLYERIQDNQIGIMKLIGEEFGWDYFENNNTDKIREIIFQYGFESVLFEGVRHIDIESREYMDNHFANQIQKVFRGQAVRNRYPAVWKFN